MKCGFVGIGVMKGASTWVFNVLSDHPQILVSMPKELDYFSKDENYNKGEDWYHSKFEVASSNDQIGGEISPSYFHSEESIKRIKEYNSDIKIIVTLRDPVQRAFSNHLHLIRRGHVKTEFLEFENALDIFPQYLEQSMYFKHLNKWFSNFPKENILVLIQEEIEQNPQLLANNLYDFLNVRSDFLSDNLYQRANSSAVIRSKVLDKIMKKSVNLLLELGLIRIAKKARENTFLLWLRQSKSAHLKDKVPPLNASTKLKLMKLFESDLIALSGLLDKDSFPWESWSYIINRKVK